MTVVLGVHSGHDAGAALVIDGKVVAAASEERFKRIKHCSDFPDASIRYVLREAALGPSNIDYVAQTDQTSLVELLVKQIKPYGLPWFINKVTGLMYNKAKKEMYSLYKRQKKPTFVGDVDFLRKIGISAKRIAINHHLAHAASAYRTSGFKKATVITLDGAGELFAGTVYIGNNGEMKKVSESFVNGGSLGLFYAAVTYGLGFKINDGEGKTMGLAAYGDPNPAYNDLVKFAPILSGSEFKNGFIWHFDIKYLPNKLVCAPIEPQHISALIHKYGYENVAAAAQKILEENVSHLVQNVFDQTGISKIAAAGGVFLNVKANKKIVENEHISDLALGAALEAYHQITGDCINYKMGDAYLGSQYTNEEILNELKNSKGIEYEKTSDVPGTTSDLLQDGKVVGWFQGRMEWGPRALGNRSVLADPRNVDVKDRLNQILKKRDWFMPFAPSILEEQCEKYIKDYVYSPFMLLAFDVDKKLQKDIPAVIHVDGTARPQGVTKKANPLYYDLIKEFYKDTGIPMILNTSFNKHGLPIVESPRDAINHLNWGCMDLLIIGNYIVSRI